MLHCVFVPRKIFTPQSPFSRRVGRRDARSERAQQPLRAVNCRPSGSHRRLLLFHRALDAPSATYRLQRPSLRLLRSFFRALTASCKTICLRCNCAVWRSRNALRALRSLVRRNKGFSATILLNQSGRSRQFLTIGSGGSSISRLATFACNIVVSEPRLDVRYFPSHPMNIW